LGQAKYYHTLFTSATPQNVDECVNAIEGRLTVEMKQELVADFLEEEVHRSLMQMGPIKALDRMAFITKIGPRWIRRYVVQFYIFLMSLRWTRKLM
jgi:hypothetical protein